MMRALALGFWHWARVDFYRSLDTSGAGGRTVSELIELGGREGVLEAA